ncbi:insulin-like peptide [Teleopsis dalmanni]|uniref:insulin-like peptide n=1 Tax=Teleopsis dalmanni TaxID=139649 RepID=UPI0018CF5585|nr:insulin-like peptide [Teleopsis dalmanni]XP_037928031.1 insulin-like peptide [Teleopsis dalmanni]
MMSSSLLFAPKLLGLIAFLFALVLLIYGPVTSEASPLIADDGTNIEFKRYCSNTLSDAIRIICGGRFNSLSRQFPDSVGTGTLKTSTLKRLVPDDHHRPLNTGPIHECCRRPCGYSELKMYCAPE